MPPTNTPFAGVLVVMTGGGVRTTDDKGQFTFKDVLPGTWTIQTLRTGTAPPARDSAPRVLTIKAGEEVRGIRLWLSPLATLRGRITDLAGNPLVRTQVEALVFGYEGGNRILRVGQNSADGSPSMTVTGTDGEFRLQLPPGTYYVAAAYTAPGARFVAPSVGTASAGRRTIRTYYPGTLEMALAASVTLASGDTVTADFRAFTTRPELPKISGTIVGTANLAGRGLRLVSRDAANAAAIDILDTRQAASPDHFEIFDVSRGRYDLIVSDTMVSGRRGRGVVSIDVQDRDLNDIVVVLRPSQDVEGKVSVQGASDAIRMKEIAIRGGPPVVMATADGTFTLRGVTGGDHPIRVDGLPPDAYVADIRQGGASLFDAARTLAGPQYVVSANFTPPLEVVLGTNGGVIEGVVETTAQQSSAGSTVVLVPGPPRQFVLTYYQTAVVGSTGEFKFQSLAPGVYQLYAWESVPNTAWLNSEFMSGYAGRGATVSVEMGKHQGVSVKLIPRED